MSSVFSQVRLSPSAEVALAFWTKPCSSVMSLVTELPPAELHCLFSLKSFLLTAQWSETPPSSGLRRWLESVEPGKGFRRESDMRKEC